jgi:hypothetical protein
MTLTPASGCCSVRPAGESFSSDKCGRVWFSVALVRTKEPDQMTLAQHDDVVEANAAYGPDQALYIRVLPRRPRRCQNLLDTHAPDATLERFGLRVKPTQVRLSTGAAFKGVTALRSSVQFGDLGSGAGPTLRGRQSATVGQPTRRCIS